MRGEARESRGGAPPIRSRPILAGPAWRPRGWDQGRLPSPGLPVTFAFRGHVRAHSVVSVAVQGLPWPEHGDWCFAESPEVRPLGAGLGQGGKCWGPGARQGQPALPLLPAPHPVVPVHSWAQRGLGSSLSGVCGRPVAVDASAGRGGARSEALLPRREQCTGPGARLGRGGGQGLSAALSARGLPPSAQGKAPVRGWGQDSPSHSPTPCSPHRAHVLSTLHNTLHSVRVFPRGAPGPGLSRPRPCWPGDGPR